MAAKKQKVQVCIIRGTQKELEVLLLQVVPERGDFWQNMTGKVDSNEAPLETAIREVQDETGLKISANDLHDLNYSFEYSHGKKTFQEFCFALHLPTKKSEIQISSEHQKFKWAQTSQVSSSAYGFESNHDVFIKTKEWYENHCSTS